MGGQKKKSLAKSEKNQKTTEYKTDKTTTKKEWKKDQATKQIKVLLPKLNDDQLVRNLASLKAITIYGAARVLGVKASIASTVLKSLTSKGLLRVEGGYSGHYVYAVSSSLGKNENV